MNECCNSEVIAGTQNDGHEQEGQSQLSHNTNPIPPSFSDLTVVSGKVSNFLN